MREIPVKAVRQIRSICTNNPPDLPWMVSLTTQVHSISTLQSQGPELCRTARRARRPRDTESQSKPSQTKEMISDSSRTTCAILQRYMECSHQGPTVSRFPSNEHSHGWPVVSAILTRFLSRFSRCATKARRSPCPPLALAVGDTYAEHIEQRVSARSHEPLLFC